MKRSGLLFLFVIISSIAFSQYSPIYVSGNVKDLHGNPVVHKAVMIYADDSVTGGSWVYNTTVYTDSLGHFSLNINPPSGVNQGFIAYVSDCNYHYQDTFFTNANQHITLNFEICIYTPPACIAYFTYDSNSPTAYTYNFHDNSTGTPTSYYWNFGDTTTTNDTSTLKNPTYTFKKGVYHVCLTIYDSVKKCTDKYYRIFFIFQCHSYFSWSFINNQTVQFSALSEASGPNTTTYNWDFGDTTTGTGQYPVHVYSHYGKYHVVLRTTIKNVNDSCVSIYDACVTINNLSTGSILGYITSKTFNVDKVLIYLIKHDPVDSTLSVVDSVYSVDSNFHVQYYRFDHIPYGNYLVKATLTSASASFPNCLPTYFGNVLFWDQATTVSFIRPNQCNNVSIQLIDGACPPGPGFIGGKTTRGANIWELNPGASIANVEVLLLDQSGNPLSYNFSKATGDFNFSNLALSTYKIYPEMAGRKTTAAVVTLDAQNPAVSNVTITINQKSVETSVVKSDFPLTEQNSGNIYPNPVQERLNINIKMQKSYSVDIKIINSLGKLISVSQHKLTAGDNIISADTRSLPQGLYHLNIIGSEGSSVIRSFVIIK